MDAFAPYEQNFLARPFLFQNVFLSETPITISLLRRKSWTGQNWNILKENRNKGGHCEENKYM